MAIVKHTVMEGHTFHTESGVEAYVEFDRDSGRITISFRAPGDRVKAVNLGYNDLLELAELFTEIHTTIHRTPADEPA